MSKSEPVAEIEPGDGSGLRFRLHDDWTWPRPRDPIRPATGGDYPASAAIREPGGVEIRTVRPDQRVRFRGDLDSFERRDFTKEAVEISVQDGWKSIRRRMAVSNRTSGTNGLTMANEVMRQIRIGVAKLGRNRPALSAARIVTEWLERLERRDAAGD